MLEDIIIRIFKDKLDLIKSNKRYRKLFRLLLFFFNLSILSIPLYLFHIGLIKVSNTVIDAYTYFIYSLLKNTINIQIKDNILIVKNVYFIIDQDCIGIKSILGIFSIILSTPTRNKRIRVKYFLIFLPIVYIANIVRIISTILLYYYFNINIYFVHNVLWEILTTSLILILWIIFYIKVKDNLIL